MSATHPKPLPVTLKPVTSPTDIPILAETNDRALSNDPLKQWMQLFTSRTEYDTTVEALTAALEDPRYHVVKAVIPDPDVTVSSATSGDSSPVLPGTNKGEKIIGFVHWFCGYIELEKVDPFAEITQDEQRRSAVRDVKDVTSNLAEELQREARSLEAGSHRSSLGDDHDRAERLKAGEAKYVESRNWYIAAIRGKKHMWVRRLMVLPEYQGRGVGGRLLRAVTDEADRMKIVCWLFGRPAGFELYEKIGFKKMAEVGMDEERWGFECSPTRCLMRAARPVGD